MIHCLAQIVVSRVKAHQNPWEISVVVKNKHEQVGTCVCSQLLPFDIQSVFSLLSVLCSLSPFLLSLHPPPHFSFPHLLQPLLSNNQTQSCSNWFRCNLIPSPMTKNFRPLHLNPLQILHSPKVLMWSDRQTYQSKLSFSDVAGTCSKIAMWMVLLLGCIGMQG